MGLQDRVDQVGPHRPAVVQAQAVVGKGAVTVVDDGLEPAPDPTSGQGQPGGLDDEPPRPAVTRQLPLHVPVVGLEGAEPALAPPPGHIEHGDPGDVPTERLGQGLTHPLADHDDQFLTPLERLEHERHAASHGLGTLVVEERLVGESLAVPPTCGACHVARRPSRSKNLSSCWALRRSPLNCTVRPAPPRSATNRARTRTPPTSTNSSRCRSTITGPSDRSSTATSTAARSSTQDRSTSPDTETTWPTTLTANVPGAPRR